jgi:hypothetical protein
MEQQTNDQGSTGEINRQLQHCKMNPSMESTQGKETEKTQDIEQKSRETPA